MIAGRSLLIPNLIRAVGQAMVFPPISMIATAGIALKDAGSASSLFNMMRNLGGAVGIATVQTFVTNREKFHSAIMTPQVSLLDPATRERGCICCNNILQSHGMSDPQAAQHEAIMAVGRTIELQSSYFAYGDAFALLGCGMVLATVAALLLRKPQRGGGTRRALDRNITLLCMAEVSW